jgi:hypothetical protein
MNMAPEMYANIFERLKMLLGASRWQHLSTIPHFKNLFFNILFKMLVSESFRSHAECFYDECHYAKCRVCLFKFDTFSLGDPNHKIYAKVILYDNK